MNILGHEFEYMLTKCTQYNNDKDKMIIKIEGRLKGETIDRQFNVEIPGINKYLEEAFRNGGLISG